MSEVTGPISETIRGLVAEHQPEWGDAEEYSAVLEQLRLAEPLVAVDDIVSLETNQAEVEEGRAFLLQGGYCAEPVPRDQTTMKAQLQANRELLGKVIVPATLAISYGTGLKS